MKSIYKPLIPLFVFLTSTPFLFADDSNVMSEAKGIHFNEDGTLKIVQFTDTHWTQEGPEIDAQTRAVMETVLDIEKPDFVVFTGDNVWGQTVKSAGDLESLIQPLVDRNIQWAWVLGNHDAEGGDSRRELMQLAMELPLSKCQMGPEDIHGASNYVIPVYTHDGSRQAASLYMLDTNAYVAEEYKPRLQGYDWIRRDQISWYLETAKKIKKENEGKTLPALAFFHIPLPEYEQLCRKKLAIGEHNEWSFCPDLNSGFFLAMVEGGDVMGTFAGHAHINDYEGSLNGIYICAGKVTGKAAYATDGYSRGGRVILLEQDKSVFRTWIRLENKEKVDYQAAGGPKVEL